MKTREQLIEDFKIATETFSDLRESLINEVNDFVKDNPDTFAKTDFQFTEVPKLTDSMILFGAWIEDRLNDRTGYPGGKTYNRSLGKKVRKVLGYTL
jgi:hypothetical protein